MQNVQTQLPAAAGRGGEAPPVYPLWPSHASRGVDSSQSQCLLESKAAHHTADSTKLQNSCLLLVFAFYKRDDSAAVAEHTVNLLLASRELLQLAPTSATVRQLSPSTLRRCRCSPRRHSPSYKTLFFGIFFSQQTLGTLELAEPVPVLEELVQQLAASKISCQDVSPVWHAEFMAVQDASSFRHTRRAAEALAFVGKELWQRLTYLRRIGRRTANRQDLLNEVNAALLHATGAKTASDVVLFPPMLESGGIHQLRPRSSACCSVPKADAESVFHLDTVVLSMGIQDHGALVFEQKNPGSNLQPTWSPSRNAARMPASLILGFSRIHVTVTFRLPNPSFHCTTGYCANIGRTLMLDAMPQQLTVHDVLRQVFDQVVRSLKAGTRVSEVAQHADALVQSWAPALLPHFTKTLGHGMGLNFRDRWLPLSAKSDFLLRDGVVLNVALGFANVPYTLSLGSVDTSRSVLSSKQTVRALQTSDQQNTTFRAPDAQSCPVPASPTYTAYWADTVVVRRNGADVLSHYPKLDNRQWAVGIGGAALCPAMTLPDELLECIFYQLDAYSLAQASMVCQQWSRVAWRRLLLGEAFVQHRVRLQAPMFVEGLPASVLCRRGRLNLMTMTVAPDKVRYINPLNVLRLPRTRNLQYLSLRNMKLRDDHISTLCHAKSLLELDVRGVSVGSSGSAKLVAAIRNLLLSNGCWLRVVLLDNCNVRDAALDELLCALQEVSFGEGKTGNSGSLPPSKMIEPRVGHPISPLPKSFRCCLLEHQSGRLVLALLSSGQGRDFQVDCM